MKASRANVRQLKTLERVEAKLDRVLVLLGEVPQPELEQDEIVTEEPAIEEVSTEEAAAEEVPAEAKPKGKPKG